MPLALLLRLSLMKCLGLCQLALLTLMLICLSGVEGLVPCLVNVNVQ